jgi:DNA-binding transcriptional LysR family regulator
MDDRKLLYIKTIAELHSITEASKKLFVSQPSLSKCISNIESELGTELFKRTGLGLIPTSAGECYYKMACQVLKIYNNFELEISDINHLQRGKITIGISINLGSYILPIVLPIFKKSCPNIEVKIVEMNSTNLKKSLVSGIIDFALMHIIDGEITSQNPNVKFLPFFKEPFLLVTQKDNPLGKYSKSLPDSVFRRMDLSVFADEPFVLVQSKQKIGQISKHTIDMAQIDPKLILSTESHLTAKRLASVGVGSTILPQSYLELYRDSYPVDCFSLDPKYKAYWILGTAILKDSYVSKSAQLFIKIASENILADKFDIQQ